MSDPNMFTVAALKELLAARELPSVGSKAELIARLMEADPSGSWMSGGQTEDNGHIENAQQIRAGNMQPSTSQQQREVELCKREKELTERELAVVRLELEATRRMLQTARIAEESQLQQSSIATLDESQMRTTINRGGDHDFIGPIRANNCGGGSAWHF
ncbi:hypothetical protein ALC62_06342 [Cyphomyrmex costatus]|uniref:SAP domain-containing protein n=1 Tax=Cyphomyrmex costatus TaxID=456900 RepID=A0A151IIZ4_9HYME|nr:hypothetical protein ALC62_06342 [Cyphomyrmex costatus]